MCFSRVFSHTIAVGSTESEDLSLNSSTASLTRAVTKTVAEAGVGAVASDVACSATELGVGNVNHARDTLLLQSRQ